MITVPLMLLIRPHDRGRPLLDQPADAGGQVRQQVRPSRRCTSGPRLDQGREGGHQGGGDGQPPAVDRERQRDRDAEQVATQGRPEEFTARDLGGDQPPVGAVELVPADDRRQYGSGRRVAQHRGQPGAEDRDADRPDRRVTGPDQRHRTDQQHGSAEVHRQDEPAPIDPVCDHSGDQTEQQPRQLSEHHDTRDQDRVRRQARRQQRERRRPDPVTEVRQRGGRVGRSSWSARDRWRTARFRSPRSPLTSEVPGSRGRRSQSQSAR